MFPADAPLTKVMRALERLGFEEVRRGNHIIMERTNIDGSITPLVMPYHKTIRIGTLRAILNQCGISRGDFLKAYQEK